MAEITLTKPFKVKGKETEKLTLDFDSLTGEDLVAAEKEARAMGDTTTFIDVSKTYHATLAARLIGCPADDVLALPAKDFQRIAVAVFAFLGTPASAE